MNILRRSVVLAVACIAACTSSSGPTTPVVAPAASGPRPPAVNIIPRPVSVAATAASFTLNRQTQIWADPQFADVARQLARYLEDATGYALAVHTGAAKGSNTIVFARVAQLTAMGLAGPHGYALRSDNDHITITAADAEGAFYGVQTLRQLLPTQIFRAAQVSGVSWTVPGVMITDEPRFQWRGSHLDVARHFMPKEFVLKYIDLLAMHKMNMFHMHLTDDQGWRVEIKQYPKLTEIGAWRPQTLVGRGQRDTTRNVYDGKKHGGYYTQDDIREIVAYAKARFITVVPEIEMPGHAQEVVAAYPELGNRGDSIGVRMIWGVSDYILKPSDETITFMQNVLTEVMALFPGPFIHIGGDEATKTQWRASPFVQERIKQLGLKDENEMQSWFIKQMDTFLTAHGRRLIGWDEILDGGIAPNAAVMSWRGVNGGIAAARQGHDVVMSPDGFTYLDHYQSRTQASEPLAIGGFLPLETVYGFDPLPAALEPQFTKHVLGAQAQLWTEYMPDQKQVEYMAFPRLCALAEVVWSPANGKDFEDFKQRLSVHAQRLEALDVNYRRGW